jgi:hypothetical protein
MHILLRDLMLVPTKIIPLAKQMRQDMRKLMTATLLTFIADFCILLKALSESVFKHNDPNFDEA